MHRIEEGYRIPHQATRTRLRVSLRWYPTTCTAPETFLLPFVNGNSMTGRSCSKVHPMGTVHVARGLYHNVELLGYHYHLFIFLRRKILGLNWSTHTFRTKKLFQSTCHTSLATRDTARDCVNNNPDYRALVQEKLYEDTRFLLSEIFVEISLNREMQHQFCCSRMVYRIKMVVKSLSRKYVQSEPIFSLVRSVNISSMLVAAISQL
jgi:hypothetical protein